MILRPATLSQVSTDYLMLTPANLTRVYRHLTLVCKVSEYFAAHLWRDRSRDIFPSRGVFAITYEYALSYHINNVIAIFVVSASNPDPITTLLRLSDLRVPIANLANGVADSNVLKFYLVLQNGLSESALYVCSGLVVPQSQRFYLGDKTSIEK